MATQKQNQTQSPKKTGHSEQPNKQAPAERDTSRRQGKPAPTNSRSR